MMLHIASSSFIGVGKGDYLGVQNKQELTDLQDHQVQAVSSVRKRHTKSLADNELRIVKESIESVVEAGLQTVEKYREMVDAKINKQLADRIATILPKTITKKLDWLNLDKETKLSFDKNTTQWKAFNDVTEMLTHEGKSFKMNMYNMQRLDKAFGTSIL